MSDYPIEKATDDELVTIVIGTAMALAHSATRVVQMRKLKEAPQLEAAVERATVQHGMAVTDHKKAEQELRKRLTAYASRGA